MPALLVQLNPRGAWRNGPATGARDRVESVLHSDTLYSALCHCFASLGWLEEWLEATARSQTPAVRVSSLFPWMGNDLFVAPPQHLWPVAGSGRLRTHGARFVPLRVAAQLISGQGFQEESWDVDGVSACLVPRSVRQGPFRVSLRSHAAVDRWSGAALPHRTACLEFSEDAGYWCAAELGDSHKEWIPRLEAAFRLLADSGLGGERSNGWGHAATVRFRRGELAQLLALPPVPTPGAHWLLSLFTAADSESVNWSSGRYSLVRRPAQVEMVGEGSVLVAESAPSGKAVDTAGKNAPHPVYRSGLALSIPVPWQGAA